MSVLEELREALEARRARSLAIGDPGLYGLSEALRILDEFEAKHPALVEITCCYCGRPVTDRSKLRATDFVCADCAKGDHDE